MAEQRTIIEVLADWESEHGSLAAIMPNEWAALMEAVTQAAIYQSPRQALSAPPPAEAGKTKPMTLAEFCVEADRIGLTAETLGKQLAARPEFADCLPPPAGARQAVADEREAFLDHWVKDVPAEYRAAARERADKDLLLSLDRGPLRVAADAWQARAALATPAAPRYGFLCYSCSHEWESNTPVTDCPSEGCGTTNNFNVDHLPAPAAAEKSVISVEDSLRTRLRWSQEKVEQLEHENRELRGRIPGASFDDLIGSVRASKEKAATPAPEAAPSAKGGEALTVAPATCRHDDGRCGICGGDWSVCGCQGMLRRAQAVEPDDTPLETGEGDAR